VSCITEFAALIEFLLDRGADPNVMRDVAPNQNFVGLTHVGGTTCDQLMDPISFFMGHLGPNQELQTILELLLEAEGHTSKPFVGNRRLGDRCILFRHYITQLSLLEDQIDSEWLTRFDCNSC